jgi:hypothetical protein
MTTEDDVRWPDTLDRRVGAGKAWREMTPKQRAIWGMYAVIVSGALIAGGVATGHWPVVVFEAITFPAVLLLLRMRRRPKS